MTNFLTAVRNVFLPANDKDYSPEFQWGRWRPINEAPNGQLLLLASLVPEHAKNDITWTITEGELVDGEWQEGPRQPDFYMDLLPVGSFKPIASAPNEEPIVLIWDDGDTYDFVVGELVGGEWQDGSPQPNKWYLPSRPSPYSIAQGRLSRLCRDVETMARGQGLQLPQDSILNLAMLVQKQPPEGEKEAKKEVKAMLRKIAVEG